MVLFYENTDSKRGLILGGKRMTEEKAKIIYSPNDVFSIHHDTDTQWIDYRDYKELEEKHKKDTNDAWKNHLKVIAILGKKERRIKELEKQLKELKERRGDYKSNGG